MVPFSFLLLMVLAVPAGDANAAVRAWPERVVPAVSNTARDGNIAIREEFERARALDTVAAWELFIARHPEHPLAILARGRLATLEKSDPKD